MNPLLAQGTAGTGFAMLAGLLAFIITIIWIVFPIIVSNGISKQREANRQIVALLRTANEQNEKIISQQHEIARGVQYLVDSAPRSEHRQLTAVDKTQ